MSVEPTDPPEDMTGTGWHCYIIEQGRNRIRGYKPGSLASVTGSVQELVARLNDRRNGKRGRAQLTLAPARKKAKGA